MLNREQIKASQDISIKDVDIPEWGGNVRLRGLGVADQIAFEKMMSDKVDQQEIMLYLVLKSCIDEKDKPLFNDEDKDWLKTKSSKAVLKIWQSALDLNYASDKQVEAEAKNS